MKSLILGFDALISAILRQKGMIFLSVISLGILFVMNAALIGPMLYKFAVVVLYAVLGYYIDRAAFYYARPHKFRDEMKTIQHGAEFNPDLFSDIAQNYNAAMLRRAIVIGATMLAGALAV